LHDEADEKHFDEIVVEFGNENWNSLFRPAGIMNAEKLLQASERAFRLMQEGSEGDNRIVPVNGLQFGNLAIFNQKSAKHLNTKLFAVAPYYAYSLPETTEPMQTLPALFPDDRKLFRELQEATAATHTEPAIYEMNAHTLEPGPPPEEVSRIVSSSAAGTALLFRSLTAMEYGYHRQCMYSLAGFDTYRKDQKLVRLFGLTRDLSGAGRFRPTGLAMAIANRAIGGELHKMKSSAAGDGEEKVEVLAFLDRGEWKFVAASKSAEELQITLTFPGGGGSLPTTLLSMQGESPLSNNELHEDVVIRSGPLRVQGRIVQFQLKPYGTVAGVSFQDSQFESLLKENGPSSPLPH